MTPSFDGMAKRKIENRTVAELTTRELFIALRNRLNRISREFDLGTFDLMVRGSQIVSTIKRSHVVDLQAARAMRRKRARRIARQPVQNVS